MNALVVGAGEMGTWFADVLCEAGFDAVGFADLDRPAAERAAAGVSVGRAVSVDTDERFDLVCVAVPLPAAAETVVAFADRARRAIVDVTGTMTDPVEAMASHAADRERVSVHPLFAAANEPGNVAIVADEPGPVTDAVRETLVERGNNCFETTPAEHDRAMETIQAKTHAAVLAFGLVADDVPDRFHTTVSEGLTDLVAHVSGGESRVYADIQAAFDGADEVSEAAGRISEADADAFRRLYEQV
jgi:prephenate dehydrogenase